CGMSPEDDRVLHSDDGAVAHPLRQLSVQAIHAGCMARADAAHLDDLAVDELHAVVLVEHPRLAHAMVLVNGEAVCGERHSHTMSAPRRRRQGADLAPRAQWSPAPSRFWGCSRSRDSGSQLIRS